MRRAHAIRGFLAGAGACPPDDVGGIDGYAHFLQAIRNPRHPEHGEMMEWHGGPFDPAAFDAHALNRAFHGGWAPRELDRYSNPVGRVKLV